MIIGVAGPYTAGTEEERQHNLDNLNRAAAQLLAMGHIPLIGINAALPVVQQSNLEGSGQYEAIMAISMAVIDSCEALLMIAESTGANRERDLVSSKGLPVYYNMEEVPPS